VDTQRRTAGRAVKADSKQPSPTKGSSSQPLAQPRHVIVVAELGSNIYPFDVQQLEIKIAAAAAAGVDAVKIQLFKAEHFPAAEQESKKKFVFPRELIPVFASLAVRHGLAYGASVFDAQAVDMAVAARCDFLKLATREMENSDLRAYCHQEFISPIYRSVLWPSGWLGFGHESPWQYGMLEGEIALGCVPEYPAVRPSWWDLTELSNGLPEPFGWSSHTQGMEDVLVAVQAGAVVIEKHMATDPADIEAEWSLLPLEFARMVDAIRKMEAVPDDGNTT